MGGSGAGYSHREKLCETSTLSSPECFFHIEIHSRYYTERKPCPTGLFSPVKKLWLTVYHSLSLYILLEWIQLPPKISLRPDWEFSMGFIF